MTLINYVCIVIFSIQSYLFLSDGPQVSPLHWLQGPLIMTLEVKLAVACKLCLQGAKFMTLFLAAGARHFLVGMPIPPPPPPDTPSFFYTLPANPKAALLSEGLKVKRVKGCGWWWRWCEEEGGERWTCVVAEPGRDRWIGQSSHPCSLSGAENEMVNVKSQQASIKRGWLCY